MKSKTVLILVALLVVFIFVNPGGAGHMVLSILGLLKEGAIQFSAFLTTLFGGGRGVG